MRLTCPDGSRSNSVKFTAKYAFSRWGQEVKETYNQCLQLCLACLSIFQFFLGLAKKKMSDSSGNTIKILHSRIFSDNRTSKPIFWKNGTEYRSPPSVGDKTRCEVARARPPVANSRAGVIRQFRRCGLSGKHETAHTFPDVYHKSSRNRRRIHPFPRQVLYLETWAVSVMYRPECKRGGIYLYVGLLEEAIRSSVKK